VESVRQHYRSIEDQMSSPGEGWLPQSSVAQLCLGAVNTGASATGCLPAAWTRSS
jgi:hypothetical protein